ncbi:hypothetical protein [Alteromonas lipotrueae]|uniref:hypothetical protein n=1 Tax=Alteromonas lipotrueae TaxID=2803814 RepID=UPI001C444433|nr:hypothetical protein [Alteromonas lipotrueae]
MSTSGIRKTLCLLILSLGIVVSTATNSEQIWFDENTSSSVLEVKNADCVDTGNLDPFLPSSASFIPQTSPKPIYVHITPITFSLPEPNHLIRAPPSDSFQQTIPWQNKNIV